MIGSTALVYAVCAALVTGLSVRSESRTAPAPTQAATCTVRLTGPVAVPAIADSGRGAAMDSFVPAYGASYATDRYLRGDVVLYRRWLWRRLYTSLDAKAQANPAYLNTYRLRADAYLTNGSHQQALAQLDQVLRRRPNDPHALAVSAIIQHATGASAQSACRLARLRLTAPAAASAVSQVLRFTRVSMSQRYGPQPSGRVTPEAIVVFGQAARDDGTPTPGLLARLTTALGLAQRHPGALLVVSGGAVRSAHSEAEAMRTWLVAQGVEAQRIVVDAQARDTVGNAVGMLAALRQRNLHRVVAVTSLAHVPRAVTTLRVLASRHRYALTVDAAGSGAPPTPASVPGERRYTYFTAARAAGLIEPVEFARYLAARPASGTSAAQPPRRVTVPAYVTAYTWWDNTPPGSAAISHPVLHRQAGGRGTFEDPVTVAVGHSIIGGRDILDYPPGTRLYFPHLRRYGIVEDTCGSGPRPQDSSCHRLDTPGHSAPPGAQTWVDLWIDGRNVSSRRAALRASAITGVFPMVINPPRGLPVR